ncbi:MAG: NAD-dependent epimerase/dehydratase family protein, partial [Candidatus Nanohaloarchaea archaeon]|nr:NAD-dependent epimerase/dehydratase family protein [Candidatus Nanohaloarchaea archaeon]
MILITGAAGFIGSHLIKELRDDHDIRGLVHSEDDIETVEELGAEAVVGDVTEPESLENVMDDIDIIIHLVAIIDGTPQEFQDIHVQGTQNILDAAPDDLDQFIHFSALGAEKESTAYFTTKREAERRVKDSEL